MKKKDVKRNLLNHSEIKIRLLREYLKRYLNIIANDGYTERIKIYDLFCGEPEWVLDIKKQCRAFKVAFFFKQWGGTNKKKTGRMLKGRTYSEMPKMRKSRYADSNLSMSRI